jgi:CBS domain-containing protein
MNVAFFLIPKSQVVWVQASDPLMTAFERMAESGFTAVPVLDTEGKCVGVLTEGDVMRVLMDTGAYWRGVFRRTLVLSVGKRRNYQAVHIDASVETLIARSINQNFVPVVDDREVFIGIVPRKPIIEHCARLAGLLPESDGQASGSR